MLDAERRRVWVAANETRLNGLLEGGSGALRIVGYEDPVFLSSIGKMHKWLKAFVPIKAGTVRANLCQEILSRHSGRNCR